MVDDDATTSLILLRRDALPLPRPGAAAEPSPEAILAFEGSQNFGTKICLLLNLFKRTSSLN